MSAPNEIRILRALRNAAIGEMVQQLGQNETTGELGLDTLARIFDIAADQLEAEDRLVATKPFSDPYRHCEGVLGPLEGDH